MFGCAEKGSPAGERFRAAECCSLSLRERVRVRGNLRANGLGLRGGGGWCRLVVGTARLVHLQQGLILFT